ncbi:hypothetical protein LZ554_008207 [Drepanopeziza brunnea f. sp. 'monogermtubi']|nr:hypothetical protein LZ554_008207 [Drepanopeziza brunnea f. sp. 'monogermtubi']
MQNELYVAHGAGDCTVRHLWGYSSSNTLQISSGALTTLHFLGLYSGRGTPSMHPKVSSIFSCNAASDSHGLSSTMNISSKLSKSVNDSWGMGDSSTSGTSSPNSSRVRVCSLIARYRTVFH